MIRFQLVFRVLFVKKKYFYNFDFKMKQEMLGKKIASKMFVNLFKKISKLKYFNRFKECER